MTRIVFKLLTDKGFICFYGNNTNGYVAGLTWSKDKLIINSKFGKNLFIDKLYYFAFGGSHSFNEIWSLGATYGKYDYLTEDPGYAVKLTYKTGMMKFSFTWDKDYYRNLAPIFWLIIYPKGTFSLSASRKSVN